MQKNNKYKYKAVSLFSGCGGIDVGISQANFDVLACIEIDPYACETLRANVSRTHGNTKVLEQDIRKIDPLDLMQDLKL